MQNPNRITIKQAIGLIVYKHSKYLEKDIKIFEVTPSDTFEKYQCQIFKDTVSFNTFLYLKNKIYLLGIGFGGFGIQSIVDFAGKLFYSYSYGSGISSSSISWFDMVRHQEYNLEIPSNEFMNKMLLLTLENKHLIIHEYIGNMQVIATKAYMLPTNMELTTLKAIGKIVLVNKDFIYIPVL